MFDLLFSLTDWLRNTFLLDFAFWITETPLSLFMVENFWNVPLAQVMHILSISAAFGATLMLSLRVLGKAGMGQTMAATSARYVRWIWWSLLVIVLSGTLMITAEPIRNMVNAVFWIKMVLLLVAVAVSLAFQKRVQAAALAGGADWRAPAGTRVTAVLLIVLWCLIMLCGRWIAYVPV
ncbi:MAG: DUF6644 family protein [Alteraurantiacibacter sp.]